MINEEILDKLRNSLLREDNELALEYIFIDYMKNHYTGGSNKSIKRKFLLFVKKDPNDAPFLGKVHIGLWFWYRFKEYNKSRL